MASRTQTPTSIGRVRRASALLLLCMAAFLSIPAVASAQAVPATIEVGEGLYEVRLADGSTLIARVTGVDGDRITLTTSGGTRLEVQRSQIREMHPAKGRIVEGEFWKADPNTSRLFFTATGRSLEKGQAYVGTYFIVLPFVAVGITDRFTFAAGAPVLFGEFEPFYIAPKLQVVRTPNTQVSLGTLVFFFDDEDVGIAYGVGTFGTPDQALTLGLGFGFAGQDFSSQPVAMVGGEARMSRRLKFVTENYFLPGETGLVFSGGIRFIGERLSTDVAVAGAADSGGGGCCLPIVNFSYALGRGR